ncbi:Transmembrane emp24 domain-containing protein p24delta5 [Linum grandiflorum]
MIFVSLPAARGIWFPIPSTGTKCVSEEIHNNVVVLADYYVINEHKPEHVPKVSARVTSPYGNNLYHQDNVTHGQFAFTTNEAGNYLACFWLDEHQQDVSNISLGLEWKTGIAAKDWDSVAKKEKIEGVELDLKRLEASVESIHQNLLYLKERYNLYPLFSPVLNQNKHIHRRAEFVSCSFFHREAEMREVSEKTNEKVAWYSIMALGVCIAVSGFQLWYLTRYFQKKKLI